MEVLPPPPDGARLLAITPEVHTIAAGTRLARIFYAGGAYPVSWDTFRTFGPTASRFDHHLEDKAIPASMPPRGIMYTATGDHALGTCLAEFFQETRLIDPRTGGPVFVVFEIKSTITLLDLSGIFATRIGASAASLSSGARSIARQWSRSLYEAYSDIDGILYGSSMYANHPAIALFERAQGAIPAHPDLHRYLHDPVMKNDLLDVSTKIGFELL